MKTGNLFNKVRPYLFVVAWISLASLVFGVAAHNQDMKLAGFVGCIIVVTIAVVIENIDETSTRHDAGI